MIEKERGGQNLEFIAEETKRSFIAFAEGALGLSLYEWQCDAIEPFDYASERLVQVSLATPNGSGKSAVVIPVLALGWLMLHPRGKVVLTIADGKQLDGQVMPAMEAYRARFPQWKFQERGIYTPMGGQFIAFTTDQAGRAEGWHKIDNIQGPLLIMVDEAKTVREDIFAAIDRCTYNAILLTSSPGRMAGRFYESQVNAALGFTRIRVGLKECPHITQDKIDRIVAQHGADSAFTRSTLHGEFMEAEGEGRFDREGLEVLREMAEGVQMTNVECPMSKAPHELAERGVLVGDGVSEFGDGLRASDLRSPISDLRAQRLHPSSFHPDPDGWLWMSEAPIPGCSYIGFCDPMTGEQSEGSKQRDTHAAGILRAPYISGPGGINQKPGASAEHDLELVAAIYVPSEEENSGAACRWDNDILAARLAMLLRFYGNCTCICEANNSGAEVMRLLLLEGCRLWRREKLNHRVPGRKMLDIVGFLTTSATKNYWIGALGTAIREQTLVCKFRPAVQQCATFILNEKGTGEAQAGCHDDWCTGLGMGIHQIHAATQLAWPAPAVAAWGADTGYGSDGASGRGGGRVGAVR